jgi:hypothetical protein
MISTRFRLFDFGPHRKTTIPFPTCRAPVFFAVYPAFLDFFFFLRSLAPQPCVLFFHCPFGIIASSCRFPTPPPTQTPTHLCPPPPSPSPHPTPLFALPRRVIFFAPWAFLSLVSPSYLACLSFLWRRKACPVLLDTKKLVRRVTTGPSQGLAGRHRRISVQVIAPCEWSLIKKIK